MVKGKKIRVLPFAKFQAILMALVGLIAGILYSFGGAIYEAFTGTLNSGTALAFLALVGMPIVFAVIGFVMGIIGAYLFNAASKWFGDIEINFEQ